MSPSSQPDEPTRTAAMNQGPDTAQELPLPHSTVHGKSAGPGLAETVSSPFQQAAAAAPPPRRFGKYEILDKIGGGGMGVVYRARDTTLGRLVALKTIRSGVLAEQVEIDRFLAEAKAIARLHDPHIVTIYDFGEQEGQPYFVMELLPGETLHKQRHQFTEADPRRAAAVVEKVARAVHLAHEHDILHRDLKPGNILLDEHGEPKVADFGLVKFLDDESVWTYAGQAIGTPSYMSPEQVIGLKEKQAPASDVWALGVVLFELLTGKRPFTGPSREELKSSIKTALPPWPRKLRHDLHVDLEAIILKCLEKDPRRRYPTALALADDLRAWQEGRPTEARPLSRWAKLGRQARRHWRMAAGVTAAIGSALLVVLAMYYGTSTNPTPKAVSHIEQLAVPADKIEAQLRAGEKVTLIGGKEKAVPFEFVAGAENSKVFREPDIGFTILAADLTILELMPKQPLGKIRFEAEAFHQSGSEASDVGIYVAHALTPHGPHQARKLIYLAFNHRLDENRFNLSMLKPGEIPAPEMLKGNHARIKTALFPFHDSLELCTNNFGASSYKLGEPTWRSLKLEMSTENLKVFFDGHDKEFASLKLADLADQCRQTNLDVVKNNPQQAHLLGIDMSFDPRAGLGLYVRQGSAAFRNVTVSPW